jgi:hypothetical protein
MEPEMCPFVLEFIVYALEFGATDLMNVVKLKDGVPSTCCQELTELKDADLDLPTAVCAFPAN